MGDYDHALIAEAEKQTRLLEQLLAEVKCLTERMESVEREIVRTTVSVQEEIVRTTVKISGDPYYI